MGAERGKEVRLVPCRGTGVGGLVEEDVDLLHAAV
jgi:hypothetical protein